MSHRLRNKNVLLGITGSIAAYKSADLVRRLREKGAKVRVTMTEHAKKFITPLTMQAVSGFPVHDALFDEQAEAAMGHIELSRWADVIVIAPATADCLTRLAVGSADDLLTSICLATDAPIVVAPAMNQGMWKHEKTQENLAVLKKKGVTVLGPGEGSQACGDVGPGRMLEPTLIVQGLDDLFVSSELAGKRVLVTAGPTKEMIDPIRFISNGSSGKMGYQLAIAAQEAGADVTLISGPTNLENPDDLDVIRVTSALQMHEEVMRHIEDYDIFIATAAVSDYRCENIAQQKIHKDSDKITLTLIRNPDIVSEVAKLEKKPFIVGFAAETENVVEQATNKRIKKQMDIIIANQITETQGMGSDENEIVFIGSQTKIALPKMSKRKLAKQLIAFIVNAYKSHIGEKEHV